MNWTAIALLIQLFFGVIIGIYFWNLLRNQRNSRVSIDRESKKRNGAIKENAFDFIN